MTAGRPPRRGPTRLRFGFLTALAFACSGTEITGSGAGGRTIEVAREEFDLRVGDTALVEGTDLTIRFVEVTHDSRCAVDVLCVWEGDGEVLLDLVWPDGGRRTTLHLNREPRAATAAGHVVTFVALAPEPLSTSRIPAGDYVATLRVEDASGE